MLPFVIYCRDLCRHYNFLLCCNKKGLVAFSIFSNCFISSSNSTFVNSNSLMNYSADTGTSHLIRVLDFDYILSLYH